MKIYFQILGTDTGDSTPSFVLHVESNSGRPPFGVAKAQETEDTCSIVEKAPKGFATNTKSALSSLTTLFSHVWCGS